MVSICIPCFNQTEFLRRNLNSILQQDFKDFEIIISDDSTTQDVELLVNELLSNKNVSFIYSKNKLALGSPANWNHAIALANGNYIKIMHHDDWFASSKSLSTFVQVLSKNTEADLVFCDTEVYDVQNKSSRIAMPASEFLENLNKDCRILFNDNQIGSPSAVMYRANTRLVFDEKINYVVDVDFYIRLLNSNPKFAYIHEALIVNTSNLPTQVTASSINKKVQIGEYCYLYNKTFQGKFPKKALRIFFKNLFSWYKLRSFNEITEMGYETPKPEWIFKYLLFLARLK